MIDVKRTDCNGTCACGVEPLAYPKYSFGMLLEARSLALEHRYHTLRSNTHNIRLHDYGTVCGLRVEKHPSPQCVNSYAILRPGIALDCCGREIVVPEDLFVPLQDGAVSGWAGAAMALTGAASATAVAATPAAALPAAVGTLPPNPIPPGPPLVPPPPPPFFGVTKLYICLRYAQCDTDPIPTYVRACGCCSPCEHGDCTPSVTREGYEVVVTSTQPSSPVNRIGKAFCDWLEVQLNGPGQSASALALSKLSLDEVICAVVTEPCSDFCADGNDLLLLATVTLDANGALTDIDNVTGRRLVIPTGALTEIIGCLTKAEIACCAATDAYLGLAGSVDPTQVNLATLTAAGDSLTYSVKVTNGDAHSAARSFGLGVAFTAGTLSFASATLTVAGIAQAAPTGDASGVTVAIPNLAAGANAQLVVTANYAPTSLSAGATLEAIAAITNYAGQHDPNLTMTTTVVDQPPDPPKVAEPAPADPAPADTPPPGNTGKRGKASS
jgi:hypothetical protein